MVLAFFDSRGLIYTNIVPRGTPVNAAYIVKALAIFWKKLKEKRPQMAAGDWFFIGTTPLSTPPPSSRTGWPPGKSRSFPTRPIRRTLHQRTSSSSRR